MLPRNRRRHSASASTPIFEPLEDRRMFSAGSLDLSFGTNGMVTTKFDTANVTATAVATQADGKIIVTGTSKSDGKVALARYNINGTLDNSFGPVGSGKESIRIVNNVCMPRAVAIQPDGKIIVAGETDTGSDTLFFVARFLPSGALDKSFDGDGQLTLDGFDAHFRQGGGANAIALQNDGKILVGGYEIQALFNANANFAVARLNTDGSLDGSFGNDGKMNVDFGQDEVVNAMQIDYNGTPASNPDYGRIVLAGLYNPRNFDKEQAAIARINSNGDLDESFDGDGMKTIAIQGKSFTAATGLALQYNGDITLACTTGSGQHAADDDFALIRLKPNGSLDNSFGASKTGIVVTDLSGKEDQANTMITGFAGNLLVGGSANGKFGVAAFTPDGLPATNFGNAGKAITTFSGKAIAGMALTTNHTFVAAGGSNFSLARHFDLGPNVAIGTFNTNMSEQGPTSGGFIVTRDQSLPFATRVFFNIGGTASAPTLFAQRNRITDYTLGGMTVPLFGALGSPTTPYVDIPAGQSVVVVTFAPIDDTLPEGTESASFTVVADSAYGIDPHLNNLTMTIADNDGQIVHDTADAYVRDGASANTNFGSATDLEVKKNTTTGVNRQIYLKFDLSNVNAATIGSVKLQLFGALNNTNQQNVATSVFGSNNTTWSENQITFNNRPPTTGGAIATTTIVNNTPQLYTWDITAYVKAQLAAGHKTITLVLQNPGNSDPFATFASKEAENNGPQLLVT
jgi:uncharacterized delta-60 repeat protein